MNTVTAIKSLDFHIFNQGIDSLQIFIRQCTLQQTIFTNRCVCFHKQSFAFDFRKKVIVINSIIERIVIKGFSKMGVVILQAIKAF